MVDPKTAVAAMRSRSLASPSPIVATRVPESELLGYRLAYFGLSPQRMVRNEAIVFGWMVRLRSAYKGCSCAFYKLSNGGFYLAPTGADLTPISVDDDGFVSKLSADAAGIVATLLALHQLCTELVGSTDQQLAAFQHLNSYQQLAAFATQHAEADSIYQAIDKLTPSGMPSVMTLSAEDPGSRVPLPP